MTKRLIISILYSFIGVISVPQFLAASDLVAVTGIDDKNVVETVVPVEPEPVTVAVNNTNNTDNTKVVKKSTTKATYVAPAPVSTPSIVNYRVTNHIGSVSEYIKTAKSLSYNSIYKYKKMIYGHNTSNLLGSLASRYVGETISITDNGQTRDYKVMLVRTYRKTSDGNLENDPYLMTDIANSAFGYDVALLTCAGTTYGNGDASHRLVVYANLQ